MISLGTVMQRESLFTDAVYFIASCALPLKERQEIIQLDLLFYGRM